MIYLRYHKSLELTTKKSVTFNQSGFPVTQHYDILSEYDTKIVPVEYNQVKIRVAPCNSNVGKKTGSVTCVYIYLLYVILINSWKK